MNYPWSKTVFPIAAIFSFRMLGLFLLIPIFSVYAQNLTGATPALIGLALGSYGLSQGILQMPFGMLSDKFGRKPVITFGLILFIIGSLMGALTHSIHGMIVARILQGTGAIGSVLIALLADLTPDKERTQAMAVIGVTIGTSFSLAMILSPMITAHYGLSGIFYFTTFLASMGLIILHGLIPTPANEFFHTDSEANPKLLSTVLANWHLQRLNASIFCQHFILTSTFFAIPLLLRHFIQSGYIKEQWHFYLPLMVFAFVMMVPLIIFSERKKKTKLVFILSIATITISQGLMAFATTNWVNFCILMFSYFVAFNLLEALLPSLVSKQANPQTKGTAMGVYSTSQFLGLFAGGALAGILFQWGDCRGIFLTNAILSFFWWILSFYIKPDHYSATSGS